MSKLISMCFPIYNRIDTFKYTFSKTIEEVVRINSDEIEVIVSVNPDEKTIKETEDFLLDMKKKTEIVVNINNSNIGIGGNGRKVFELATGKYIWMIGDDDFILPGCLETVLSVAKEYPDVGWIHLEHARMDGYPNDDKAKIILLSHKAFRHKGYCINGKEAVIEAHNISGSNTLFSSTNLYLKEAWQEIASTCLNDNPQLSATFCSASKGGVYFDDKIAVVAGGERSWDTHADYSLAVNYFKDMYYAIDHGFTKDEINRMIRYTMRHEKLTVWFRVVRLILKERNVGIQALGFFYGIMPVQTMITLLLLPLIGVYFIARRPLRNYSRRVECREYSESKNADPYVVSRLQ